MELLSDQRDYIVGQCGVQQAPEIIPASILRNQGDDGLDVIRVILSHLQHRCAEQASLAKTATDVTGEKQPLHGDTLILKESLDESVCDVLLGSRTQGSNCEVEIQQCATGSTVSNCTILGDRRSAIKSILDSRHKVCAHFLLPPKKLRYPEHLLLDAVRVQRSEAAGRI